MLHSAVALRGTSRHSTIGHLLDERLCEVSELLVSLHAQRQATNGWIAL
ncbi:MAG: hypothetical protein M5U15_06980 [Kiritimatiellae bacterium]|nr:hypothetical protein [Kiritimatiellia bacterium]